MPHGLLAAVLTLAAPPAAADADYTREVKPLLRARCAACHGMLWQKAKLRLDTGPLILRGGRSGPGVVPDESPLVEAVLGQGRPRMPPAGEAWAARRVSRHG